MTDTNHTTIRAFIDDHFHGCIAPKRERRMREHLPECADCRGYYDRHLLLAAHDPSGLAAQERLGRALGFGRSRPHVRFVLAPALVACAALAIFVAPRLHTSAESPSFVPRGSNDSAAGSELRIYRFRADRAPEVAGDSIRSDDELAFAYRNATGKPRLLIFGMDEHRHIYWYHPAWIEPAANPEAVPVAVDRDMHELSEAIAHRLDGKTLTIVAIFTDRAMTVREIEAAAVAAPDSGRLPLAGVVQLVRKLEVTQ